jgi:NAD(P)-dependent dehydrogenase (short-subunit alcohol dehydrogenase family)
LIVARLPQTPRRFAVVGETKGLGAALAARLRARGDQASLSEAGAVQPLGGAELVYLGAASLADRAASDGSALAQSERLAVQIPLRLLQELAKDSGASRAVLVTRGAASALGAGAPGARWQAPLHGLGRVFALEHPTRWRALVDLDPAATVEVAAEHLMAALDGVDREDQIAWREGARLAPRLTPAQPPRAEPATFRPDATYLVTGGGGGLGLVVARWMADRGARRIALMGRRPIPDSDAIRGIEALGARTMRLACDIADPAALVAVLRALAAEGPPLAGIMHAAADISGASFAELAPDAASRMLRPKLAGTLALEQAVGDATLDFLVLFSSTTALFGASGLAHYAAANAFLDATAHAPHPAFRRVVAINWGTWAEMRLASADHRASFREAGLEPMAAEVALDALGRLLASDVAQAAVAAIDWSVLKPMHEARRPRPFLARLSAARADQARPQAASVSGLLDELANALPDMRREILTGFVRRQVAIVLGRASDDPIPVDTGLFDLGMDSLMSLELKRRLESGCAQALPSTLTFNYPNVAALSGYLESALNQSHKPGRAEAAAAPEAPVSPEDLDELSDDELEARLMSRLEQVE